MARFKIVSVFDSAAGVYARPFPVVATGQAVRDFSDEVNRSADDNPLYRHPDDYALFELGWFDDNTGEIVGVAPVSIVRGKDVVKG